ncbi:MAG: bifunctional (p)ppGpp synthetase/guanosine-3',5'-bis(diphosphate) 3'-pyrophosphohydrolase [Candidatus Ancillula sp.]|jgi:GTP pyrophosphokinase|nr:bifunctional (p)ppGpp synthetase/guanosine-3',5'-bis(diphosphate) 3'-pyrophosphohydrolase [Candidatus Ancillula sp.]
MDILQQKYDVLVESLRARFPDSELKILEDAYHFARDAHDGQLRKSGEPFFIHPIEVTQILADLGMGVETLTASLLHDTVEDTSVTIEDITTRFKGVVANLVDGVTKLTKLQYGDNADAETIRKMIIAMSKDIRVLIIKLADRLHNARTWKYVSVSSAQRKAKETLDIYAPLAHRLGLNQIKRELEDLSFHTLYPKVYMEIESMVSHYAPERDEFVDKCIEGIYDILDETRIRATVTGRPKHFYSIYQKMIVKGRDFKDIYDLVGIRIITDTILDCYGALGAVHAKWNHLPGRFKDYIAMPKYNMYQSIHTTVLGPGGRTIEIQIRTKEMHQFAQFGVAAHWRYKSGDDAENKRSSTLSQEEFIQTEENLKWVKQLVDWQQETEDSVEFLESLRFDLNTEDVYVFSPKGTAFTLPKGATPVDFAYSVHTEVGHKTMGARVNGKLVPLSSVLQNGDTVEILTAKSDTTGPSQDWLNFVKSQRARNKIRAWFSKSRREEDIERGKEELAKAIKGKNLPFKRLLTHEVLLQVADEMHQKSVDDLYRGLGRGDFAANTLLNHILHIQHDDMVDEIIDERTGNASSLQDSMLTNSDPARKSVNPGISVSGVEGENDVWVKLAKCCTPVPGDEIIGFVTKGNGISVHRSDCYNIHVLHGEVDPGRFVPATWVQGASTTFLANIQVEGIDRAHMLADVTKVLSENHVNILSGQVDTSRDRIAMSRWTFEMADPAHLARIMTAIRKIDGVFDVYRVTGRLAK